jgi:hypothetical protein
LKVAHDTRIELNRDVEGPHGRTLDLCFVWWFHQQSEINLVAVAQDVRTAAVTMPTVRNHFVDRFDFDFATAAAALDQTIETSNTFNCTQAQPHREHANNDAASANKEMPTSHVSALYAVVCVSGGWQRS